MRKYYLFFLIGLFLISSSFVEAAPEETLVWRDCVKEAAKNHPDLISAQQAVKQSEASKDITASALYPQITGSGNASRSGIDVTTAGQKTTRTTNEFNYGVSGSQLLFDGFKTIDNVKAASENIKAAQYNFQFTSAEVRWRLRYAFSNLLRAQESVNNAEEIRKIRQDNLELIKLRYDSGIEHKGALLTAEANLAQAEYELAQNKRAVEVAQRQLIKEMGRKQFSSLRAEGELKVSDAVLIKPDFEKLAQNNPSLEKLIAQKNAASFGIKAAQADFFPQLSAQGGAFRTGTDWPPDNNQWNAGLALTYPLLEGGLRFAQVAQARAIYYQAQANEQSAKDGIIATLEQTWAILQDAVESVEVQRKFLGANEERSKIAGAQYSIGAISYDNWTIIEDDLVKAKKALLNAEAIALFAEADWIQAKGETLEYA